MADSSNSDQNSSSWWGSWSSSAFTALQKAADELASTVANSTISDSEEEKVPLESVVGEKDEVYKSEVSDVVPDNEEEEMQRKKALERLEKASQDSLFGHGLKVFDNSVGTITTGAWQVFENAWKGGSNLVQESIQKGSLPIKAGDLAPALIERGMVLKTKGMQVFETVHREAMDLLAAEAGIDFEKENKEKDPNAVEEQDNDEATFARCFYIYGGPEQLEELEALSNHYTLVCNRSKAKLPKDEKTAFDGMLKQVQQIFTLANEIEGSPLAIDKGKSVESDDLNSANETTKLCESSISKAAEMASGFTATLAGLPIDDIVKKTGNRLQAIRTEGVHRLAELCCLGISELILLGRSVLVSGTKPESSEENESILKIVWPDDIIQKAKLVREKAQAVTKSIEAVSNSFTTGISDVIAAYQEATRNALTQSENGRQNILHETSIMEKSQTVTNDMESDGNTAIERIQDALQHLVFVVFSTAMKN